MTEQESFLRKLHIGMEGYRQLAIYVATRSEMLPSSPEYIQSRVDALALNLEQLKQEINQCS